MVELVIFDCDGVLVDSEPITCAVLARAMTEIGLPTTTEECMRDYVGLAWPDTVARIEASLGHELPPGFVERYRERQDAALAAEVEPVAGVEEMLERIPVEQCVASNGREDKMRVTLGRTGLLPRFEGKLFSAFDDARGKPAPDLFLRAAEHFGFLPGECAVVEDTSLGVEAAVAAGMRAYGFSAISDRARLEAAGALAFDSMHELPPLLGFDRRPAA